VVSYILDTNVVSEMTKRNRSEHLQAWLDTIPGPSLHLSVLVFGEIRKGVELLRRRDPVQAGVYEVWLERLQDAFRTRVVPVTVEVAEEWGRMNGIRPVAAIDGLIAATARTHGWVLATRNEKDFAGLDVKMINPFEWPV
jgi:predicted nucleic acid-binding protein